jgi:hypothetical protein
MSNPIRMFKLMKHWEWLAALGEEIAAKEKFVSTSYSLLTKGQQATLASTDVVLFGKDLALKLVAILKS